MKKILFLLSVFAFSFSGFSTELVYQWKKGDVYRFQASAVDDIDISMGGMMGNMMGGQSNMLMQYTTNTTFILLITSVDVAGTANGILYLEKFSVVDKQGRSMASMKDIPASAIQSDVVVDRKGNFKFMKEIYMVMTETSNVLVSGKATANVDASGSASASATARSGNQEVSAYAEFDPKTGSLKSGYSVKTVAQTKPVTIAVKVEDPTIDILPYKFLELLLLPDGDLNQGDVVNMQVATQKIRFSVASMENGIANLQTDLAADKDASMTKSSMDASSPANGANMAYDMDLDENGMPDMNMDMHDPNMDMDMEMPDMGDMGMSTMMGMPGMGGSASVSSMMPTMTGTIIGLFDYFKGMFKTINGSLTTSMDTMGMKMNMKTTVSMKVLQ